MKITQDTFIRNCKIQKLSIQIVYNKIYKYN